MSSGISFMVGTLGILSIMILLVRSRRLEIGIRRAVGARRQSIVLQFLLEAGLMSGTGGILGVCGALLCVTVVYRVGDFPYVYDPLLIALSCGASILFGLIAGAYPAWKASRVEVLDVLRSHDS
jgi:putative ABC transport system permease protein